MNHEFVVTLITNDTIQIFFTDNRIISLKTVKLSLKKFWESINLQSAANAESRVGKYASSINPPKKGNNYSIDTPVKQKLW